VWRFDHSPKPEPAFFDLLKSWFTQIQPPVPVPFGRSVAFLVGVGTYRHLDTLTHTASDVSGMRNFLIESGGFDTVFEVRDEKVNRSLLNKYMLNSFRTNSPKYLTDRDRFLFYYSGHGGNLGDLGYLLFSNADPKSGDYDTGALNMREVRDWAYVNVARQVLLILDTCNSGLAIQPQAEATGGLGDDPSGILLTAGTGNEEAYQVGNNQKGYGIFTNAILKALQAGMNTQTPFMDVFEVYSRARSSVLDFDVEKGKKMRPDIDHRLKRQYYEQANGNFVFLNLNPVAKNSKPEGPKFAGLAVQKKGVSDDQPSNERLRAAREQFELLKNSNDSIVLRTYAADFSGVPGALTWVALINNRLNELTSASSRVPEAPIAPSTALTILRHKGSVSAAAFSPDGTRVVTASSDQTAIVWDVKSGRTLVTLRGTKGPVTAAKFSLDGTWVVTTGWDGVARIWNVESGLEIASLADDEIPLTSQPAFSQDGKRVLTASWEGVALVWDAITGRPLARLGKPIKSGQTNFQANIQASFSPDGTQVLMVWKNVATVWDINSARALATLSMGAFVSAAAFSPDGKWVMIADSDGAQIWDATTGNHVATLPGPATAAAAFSPDGMLVVTAGRDGTARVWDAKSGREVTILTGHRDVVSAAAFSPDGTRVVTASSDKTARVWDVKSGRTLVTFTGHGDAISTAAFSPDGTLVLTASSDRTARIWNANGEGTGNPLERQR
jgi:WD40 repeat protein